MPHSGAGQLFLPLMAAKPSCRSTWVCPAMGSRGKKTGSLLEDFGTLEFEGHQEAFRYPQGSLSGISEPEDHSEKWFKQLTASW